jgi:hypothetical protein
MAQFLEHSQCRINDAWARAIGSANLIFDLLDYLVTVSRPFGDEMKNDQAQIAVGEEAAERRSAAATVPPVSELWILVAVFPAGETLIVVTGRVSMMHGQSE